MRILVLFNLKNGVDPAEYEAWAAGTDVPTIRGLPSIDSFRVHALTGLLMGEGKPPFAYAEVIDVADPDQFGADVSTPGVKAIAAQFQKFADNPVFLTTREVGG